MKQLLFLVLFVAQIASAATYYVDFDGGSDAANGTSTGTAWKNIPGTRNAADSADIAATFGSFTTSAKVPAGTTFKLKSGTTHDSTDGGIIKITSDWYDNASSGSPTTFQVDTSWGSGAVTIDGTGITADIALVLVQRNGIIIDGSTTDGLIIRDSERDGIQFKEQAGSSAALSGVTVWNTKFLANCTISTSDATGSGLGQLSVRRADGVDIWNCNVDANNMWCNGFLMGESTYFVTNAVIRASTTRNCRGDTADNDSGIGVKAFNSFLTITNHITSGNLKGFDLGEQNGGGAPINYRVIACTVSNNWQGANFNGPRAPNAGAINFYVINSLIVSNVNKGLRAYAGPFNLHVVHSVFDNNGGNDTSGEGCSIHYTADTNTETNAIVARIYNTITRRSGAATFVVPYAVATNQITLDADYNSYEKRASEAFCKWSYYQAPAQDYAFGANGPGKSSGDWFTEYYTTTTQVGRGTGHFGADANSKGTDANDTTLPSFVDVTTHDYTLTAAYAGTDLSGKSWYIAEMGFNRDGSARTWWDMGMQDYNRVTPLTVTGRKLKGVKLKP